MEQELNQTDTSTTAPSDLDRLAASVFGIENVASAPVNEANTNDTVTTTNTEVAAQAEPAQTEAAVLPNELKTNLGFDTWDDAKTQFEELKTLKETASTKEEIKFANEQSKKFFDLIKEGKEDDLYTFLNEKKKIDKLTSVEVNNETAEDIIKLSIATKNKNLSSKEIDFLYKQDYVAPKEPTERASETEAEFEERLSEWKEKLEIIEMKRMVAAKMAQPELEKLKSELVLPDIQPKESQTQQPSQEELDFVAKSKDMYLKSTDTVLKEMNEFNIVAKDGDVEIPLSYVYSDDEKKAVNSQLKELAELDFSVTQLFNQRWSNKDGTVNVSQLAKDFALLNNGDKAIQKFVNDATAKARLKYMGEKTNIQVNGNSSNGTFSPQGGQSQLDKLAESFFADTN